MYTTMPPFFEDVCYLKLNTGYSFEHQSYGYEVYPIKKHVLQERLPILAACLEKQPKVLGYCTEFPAFLNVTPDVMRLMISWAYYGTLYSSDDGQTIMAPDSRTVIYLYVMGYNIGSCDLQNDVIKFLSGEFQNLGRVITDLVHELWIITAHMSSQYHCALRNLIWDQCTLLNVPIHFHLQANYPTEFLEGLFHRILMWSTGQYDPRLGYNGIEKYFVMPCLRTSVDMVALGSSQSFKAVPEVVKPQVVKPQIVRPQVVNSSDFHAEVKTTDVKKDEVSKDIKQPTENDEFQDPIKSLSKQAVRLSVSAPIFTPGCSYPGPEEATLVGMTTQNSDIAMRAEAKPDEPTTRYIPPHMRKIRASKATESNGLTRTASQLSRNIAPNPVGYNNEAIIRAQTSFTEQFPNGAVKISTSPRADLCGLEALIFSINAQHASLKPTSSQFKEIVASKLYSDIVEQTLTGGGKANDSHFTADQLALILRLWGEAHGKLMQLGYVQGDNIPQLVPVENSEAALKVWIENDNAEAEFEKIGFAAKGHWSGLEPSLPLPLNKSIIPRIPTNTLDLGVSHGSWAEEVEDLKSDLPITKLPWTSNTTPPLPAQLKKGPTSETKSKNIPVNNGDLDIPGFLAPIHADICPHKLLRMECPHGKACKLKGICGNFAQKNGCKLQECKYAHVLGGCNAAMEEGNTATPRKCKKKGPVHMEKIAHKGQGSTEVQRELDWKSRCCSFRLLYTHAASTNGDWS